MSLKKRILKLIFGERRKHPRYRVYETLYLDYECPKKNQKGSGEGLNVSLTGLRFASDKPLEKDDKLILKLRFSVNYSKERHLKIPAKVIRCGKTRLQKRYRIACQFLDLPYATMTELAKFIAWLIEVEEKYLFFRYRKE